MNISPTTDRIQSAGGTESADRVADVLLLFSRSDHALGVSRIARTLGLSKAVVHRILQSLVTRSILQIAPGSSNYTLGPAAIGLATKAWSQLDIRPLAAPILRKLRDDTRETTTLSVLTGHYRIYLDQYESPQEVKMIVEIGPRFSLHSGASSRSILAFLPQPYIDAATVQVRSLRPEVNVDQFLKDLQLVRERGYAISMNERNTGAFSIAAPFFDEGDNVLGSVSSSGPIFRYGEDPRQHERHARMVIEAAQAITDLLSH